MGALNLKLNSFSGVAAGQTASLVVDPGPYYQEIYLKYPGAIADLESIKCKLNSVELFDLSATQLRMLNDYYGLTSTAGYYSLPLSCAHVPELARRLQTGLATFPGDNLVIEVKIAAGATNPTLEAFAEVRNNPGVRPFVRRFMPYTIQASAAGGVEFTSFDKGPRVIAAHFSKSDISEVKIERDKQVLFEMDADANKFVLKREGRMPQANYFHIDPTRVDYPIDESMVTKSASLAFKLNVDSGGSIPVLFDVLDADPRLVVNAAPAAKTGGRRRLGRR